MWQSQSALVKPFGEAEQTYVLQRAETRFQTRLKSSQNAKDPDQFFEGLY